MGRDGNYWGHNAIIRTRAFAAHCGMPDLRGRPPFGGHILSHDFVEAALMPARRMDRLHAAGARRLLRGEPALADRSRRPRPALVPGQPAARAGHRRPGFTLATRQHFATGIMCYLASPLWLAQLLVGIVLVLQAHYIRPEYFTDEFSLFPAWPRFDCRARAAVVRLTIGVLLGAQDLRPRDLRCSTRKTRRALRRDAGAHRFDDRRDHLSRPRWRRS